MQAIVYEHYGSPQVLELRVVAKPTVAANGVLVRVCAASVNRSDWEALTGRPAYVRLPGAGFVRPKHRILGSDIAGTVEEVGKEVTRFRAGDEVFGDTLYFGVGGFAEYVSVPERAPLAHKPATLTFEEAASLPQAAVLALQGLRVGGSIEPGERVLIIGAGGGGGSFAVQIAKSVGAEVTGVDGTPKLDMMRSIGADHVIDYTREDFAKDAGRYDRILDFAADRSVIAYRRAMAPGGVYAMVGGSVPRLLQTLIVGSLVSRFGDKRMRLVIVKPNRDDLLHAAELVAAGTIKPVIHQRYELSQVPEALTALGQHRVLGKAVITVGCT